jgi:hypothetical protein
LKTARFEYRKCHSQYAIVAAPMLVVEKTKSRNRRLRSARQNVYSAAQQQIDQKRESQIVLAKKSLAPQPLVHPRVSSIISVLSPPNCT